jgi:hypothetical protein
MRGLHAFCVCFTPAGSQFLHNTEENLWHGSWLSNCLIMKLRGIRLELPTGALCPAPVRFFLCSTTFFAFYLTGAGVFYNQQRSPAG